LLEPLSRRSRGILSEREECPRCPLRARVKKKKHSFFLLKDDLVFASRARGTTRTLRPPPGDLAPTSGCVRPVPTARVVSRAVGVRAPKTALPSPLRDGNTPSAGDRPRPKRRERIANWSRRS